MKVLINAINARLGGGQTYLYNLLAHFPTEMDIEVVLLVGSSFKKEFPLTDIRCIEIPTWVEHPLLRFFWERWWLPSILSRGHFDVLFCPGGVVSTVPPATCRVVTMFRNMIPFDIAQRKRYPLGYQRLRNWLLARVMLRSMTQADLVIFIADYARQVIESHMSHPLRNYRVIPHGIAQQFRFNGDVPLQRPTWVPLRYLLYVSNVDVYKAQLQVVQAFADIHQRDRDVHLILIGPEREFYAKQVRQEIIDLGLSEYVHMRGKVSYASLPALYQHAEINIFASECENCPNILLEAMASGRPVVCSERQPMPEFAADAVLYFDPETPTSLVKVLLQLLAQPEEQQRYGDLAIARSASYSWTTTAEQTWAAIHSLGL